MQPFEGIRSRQRVDEHPESSKIRPHSRTFPSPAAVGTGVAAARAGGAVRTMVRERGRRVPVPLSHTFPAEKTSPKSGNRPVLLPVKSTRAFARSTSPNRTPSPPVSPPKAFDDLDGPHPIVHPLTYGQPTQPPPSSPGRISPPPGTMRSPFANPRGTSPPRIRAAESPPPPQRKGSVTVTQLAPYPPGQRNQPLQLKHLALDSKVPDFDPANVCISPRFNCPRNVDCSQGAGPQCIAGFVLNPDEDNEEVDQAIMYHVQTQNEELFSEPPEISFNGTLSFTPSNVRHGVAMCAIMAVDHAAVRDGEILSSGWVGFTITIQPTVTVPKGIKARDWRSHQNKMTAPVAEVPHQEKTADPEPCTLFETEDIHKLRSRLQQEEKASRDKAILLIRCATLVKPVSFLSEYESLRDNHTSISEAAEAEQQHLTAAFGVVPKAQWKELLEAIATDDCPPASMYPGVASLMEKLGKACVAMGHARHEHAEMYFKAAVRLYRSQIGILKLPCGGKEWEKALLRDAEIRRRDPRDSCGHLLVSSLTLLGVFYKHTGRLREAIDTFSQALSQAKVQHSATEDNPYTLLLLLQISEVQLMQGDGAAAHETTCMARAHSELGMDKGERVGDVYYMMAVGFALQGDFAQAQSAFTKCIAARKSNLGSDHILVAEALMALARVCDYYGKAEQCTKAAQEAVEIAEQRKRSKGGVVPLLSHALATLALSNISRGKYSAALPLLEKAKEAVSSGGSQTLNFAYFTTFLGAFHCSQKRYDAAQGCLDPSLRTLGTLLGRHHYLTSICKGAVAWVKFQQGRVDEARGMAAEVKGELADLSPTHDLVGLVAEVNGDICLEGNYLDDAFDYYTAARRVVSACASPMQRMLRQPRLMERLTAVHCRIPRVPSDELVEDFKAALAERQHEHGEWDIQVSPFLQNLGELQYLKRNYDEALALFVRVLKIADNQNMVFLLGSLFKPAAQLDDAQIIERNRMAAERLGGGGALHFAVILLQVAAVHEARRAWSEAEATYLQARAAFEIAGHPHHSGVCTALDGLGRILFNSGLFGDALSYFHKSLEMRDDHFRDHEDFAEQMKRAEKNVFIVNKKLHELHYVLERYEVPGNPTPFPVYI